MELVISKEKPGQTISFVSLGMIVLDELRFPGQSPLIDVLGGSGVYSTLGARLFAGTRESKSIGCLVKAGKDFPEAAENRLRDWEMSMVMKRDAQRLSTRGLLEYEDTTFGRWYIAAKKFRYITEPLKSSPADVRSTTLLRAQAFHFLATPEEVTRQIPELIAFREECGIKERPLLVWEPFPAACKPQNREPMLEACRLVDVFSPNHFEMSALFSQDPPKTLQPGQLEDYANVFLDSTVGHLGQGYVVVRAAEHGCLVACRSEAFAWFPAFYAPDSPAVKDPTGAGNAFLGGFTMGLQKHKSPFEAASYGNVAASFALEQIGLPSRGSSGEKENWNGQEVLCRLEEYRGRLQDEHDSYCL